MLDPLIDILSVSKYLAQQGLFLNASIRLVDIGNINYVYRLNDLTQGTFYLKYYGLLPRRTTAAIEKIGYEPARFMNEYDALLLLSSLLDPLVASALPRIVHVDAAARVLILSDIACDRLLLRELLLANPALAAPSIAPLAHLLAQQHARTLQCTALVQHDAFNKRFYDFRTIHSCPALSREQQHTVAQRAQNIWEMNTSFACLINADFSPKQIYVAGEQIGLCDFELVSLGVASYDVGFFIGQMKLVEYITGNALVGDLAAQFLAHYFATLTKELPERPDFLAFTREHVDFFIGLGILNRLDAVPLESFIPVEKVPYLRACALSFIFPGTQPEL